MIRIPIKNGDIDAACAKLNEARKEQDKAFDERVAGLFSPQATQEPTQQAGKRPAPSYQSLLARSRRVG